MSRCQNRITETNLLKWKPLFPCDHMCSHVWVYECIWLCTGAHEVCVGVGVPVTTEGSATFDVKDCRVAGSQSRNPKPDLWPACGSHHTRPRQRWRFHFFRTRGCINKWHSYRFFPEGLCYTFVPPSPLPFLPLKATHRTKRQPYFSLVYLYY